MSGEAIINTFIRAFAAGLAILAVLILFGERLGAWLTF